MIPIKTLQTSSFLLSHRGISWHKKYPKLSFRSIRFDNHGDATKLNIENKKYRGVTKVGNNQWRAKIINGGVTQLLGVFDTSFEAAKAYDTAAITLGRNTLNFPYNTDNSSNSNQNHPTQSKETMSSISLSQSLSSPPTMVSTQTVPNSTWLSRPQNDPSEEYNHLKTLGEYHGEYWELKLSKLERPASINLVPQLNNLNVLGYEASVGLTSNVPIGQVRSGTMLAFILEQKAIHQDKIVLIRVGEFFEAYGIDAVLMVEHCGLNPMGGRARCGMPWKNIQSSLDGLVSAGYSIAVYEEVNLEHSKSKTKRGLKSRFLSQIVSPASPTYLYDSCLRGDDVEFRVSKPYAAIAYAPTSGYSLVIAETPVEPVWLGLGTSAADLPWTSADITSSPFLNDVHIHDKKEEYSFPLSSLLLNKISSDFMIDVSSFRLVNSEVLTNLKIHKNGTIYDAQSSSSSSFSSTSTPHPLYISTAAELGLLESSLHVADLSGRLLANNGAASQRRQLRRWLLSPPPHPVADARCQVLRILKGDNSEPRKDDDDDHGDMAGMQSLPPLKTQVPLGKLVSMLTMGQANPPLLRDIASMVHTVLLLLSLPPLPTQLHVWSVQGGGNGDDDGKDKISKLADDWLKQTIKIASERSSSSCSSSSLEGIKTNEHNPNTVNPTFESLVGPMLVLTAHESGLPVSRLHLSIACANILAFLTVSVAPPPQPSFNTSSSSSLSSSNVPDEFIKKNEMTWRNTVRLFYSDELLQSIQDVDVKLKELQGAIQSDFPSEIEVGFDALNNMLLLRKDPLKSTSSNEIGIEYFEPRDRNGKVLKGKWSSRKVEACSGEYIAACSLAEANIRKALSSISRQLSDNIPTLVSPDSVENLLAHSSHWVCTLQTLSQHSAHANKLNWCLPNLVNFPEHHHHQPSLSSSSSSPSSSSSSSSSTSSSINDKVCLSLSDLVPYWIDGTGRLGEPISNSFTMELGEMMLLTAPNMSGKSTLMRSLLSACLLANCGLHVPATKAAIPRFDALFLRCAGNDSPIEGKSGWGMEADEIRALLRDSTSRSLVMIDEIARGTSARDGAAISGALLEAMDSVGSTGIFSTHLHELLELPLQYSERVSKRRMGVKSIASSTMNDTEFSPQFGDIDPEWTYQLEDGICVESLAIHTGRRFGLPEPILQRAAVLAVEFDTTCRAVSSIHHSLPSLKRTVQERSHDDNTQTNKLSSSLTIESIGTIMKNISDKFSSSTSMSFVSIPSKWNVPPQLQSGVSCVYILQVPRILNNQFYTTSSSQQNHHHDERNKSTNFQMKYEKSYYVGETDSLHQRLNTHRRKKASSTCSMNEYEVLLWEEAHMVAYPVSDKSCARQVETALIQELSSQGVSLISDADGKHQHFGK